MFERAQISRARFIVFLAALVMIIVGLGVVFFTMVNIQDRENALKDSSLPQEERWAVEGSLQWWRQESMSMFYPASAILIVLGVTAILYVVLVR